MSLLFFTLDVWLLLAAQYVIEFLQDWCSLAQRRLERVMIALTLGLDLGWFVVTHRSAWYLFGTAFCALLMVSAHRISNRSRALRLLTADAFAFRLVMALLQVFNVVIFFATREPWDLLWLGSNLMYAASFYVMAWPSGGDLGGKRKAAKQKIVDSFGREYVPEGAGA